jgi:hypothetical protein
MMTQTSTWCQTVQAVVSNNMNLPAANTKDVLTTVVHSIC